MRTWAIGLLAAGLALTGCGDKANPEGGTGPLTQLVIKDGKIGTGPGAQIGDTLIVEYAGKLADGTTFDSTGENAGAPFQFVLADGNVIKGWVKGLIGMKEGGTRRLSIPTAMAYGDKPTSEKIPPNADLFFEVKLDKLIQAADMNDPVIDHFTKHGTGMKAKIGDTVTILYRGYYANGNVFDAGGQPFLVKIGSKGAVPGMEAGMIGRQKGDVFRLTIPPKWGYGMTGGPTGKAEWMLFDIQVIDVKH